ncbi:MAG: hypothetical protein IJ523_00660, partial [Succinivibrionaceae bacterium]|nr:hypothetical protein [Succinivibrionaceae bacterium]
LSSSSFSSSLALTAAFFSSSDFDFMMHLPYTGDYSTLFKNPQFVGTPQRLQNRHQRQAFQRGGKQPD